MSFSHKQVFVKSSDKLKGRSVMLLISSSLSVLMVCLCSNVCLWSILPNWVFLRENVQISGIWGLKPETQEICVGPNALKTQGLWSQCIFTRFQNLFTCHSFICLHRRIFFQLFLFNFLKPWAEFSKMYAFMVPFINTFSIFDSFWKILIFCCSIFQPFGIIHQNSSSF